MADDLDNSFVLDLVETGRLSAGLGMHIENVIDGRRTLRRKLLRQHSEFLEIRHLLRSKKLVAIHPTLLFIGGADL